MPDAKIVFADGIAFVHAVFSVFVLIGLAALIAGLFFRSRFVLGEVVRTFHLIAVVALLVRLLLGLPCPFSVAETYLRGSSSSESRTVRVLHRLAFRNANPSNFQWSTIVVGLLTLGLNLCYSRSGLTSSSMPPPLSERALKSSM